MRLNFFVGAQLSKDHTSDVTNLGIIRSANSVFGWLAEMQIYRWPAVGKQLMPPIPWFTVYEEIWRFWEMGADLPSKIYHSVLGVSRDCIFHYFRKQIYKGSEGVFLWAFLSDFVNVHVHIHTYSKKIPSYLCILTPRETTLIDWIWVYVKFKF